MKGNEIKNLLKAKDIVSVLRSGRRPLIAAYRVAHEGISTGPVSGVGRAAKRWNSSRVNELAERLGGAPIYIGHQYGAGPRRAVGYVLSAKALESHNGAEAVAVVAVEDPRAARDVEEGKLNVASIEADLVLEPEGNQWQVAGVEAITGLALASSQRHSPGFSRAALLACTHELDGEDDPEPEPARESPVERTAAQAMENLNLTDSERRFVMNRVAERLPGEAATPECINDEVGLAISALDEAKRLYRRPPAHVPVPFERHRGPVNYADPEHNDLIPRIRRP